MTDGLSSNTIYCSMQDRHGFIWIGTRDGLCRYDGKNFRTINELAPDCKASGTIYAVEEDGEGKIWFSSPQGVGFYNPDTGKYTSLGMPGTSNCTSIVDDRNGSIWMVSDMLFKYDNKVRGIHAYTFQDHIPVEITIDSYGTVWVATDNGALYAYDQLKDSFKFHPNEHFITKLQGAEAGKLLIATDKNEVLNLDCVTLKGESVFVSENQNTILCIQERERGEIWIGTENGLFIRKSDGTYKGEAFHDDATPESISADYITSLATDRKGNMWVGTYYTGLNLWQNKDDEISRFFMNPSSNTIMGKVVRCIRQDMDGYLWICTEDGWLNRYNPADHSIRNYMIDKGLNLQGLIMDEEQMWICTYGNGIYRFDLKRGKVLKHYNLPDNWATSGIKTATGDILVGTTSGIYAYDSSDDEFRHTDSIGKDFAHCFYQDSCGLIWIGTFGNGIHCIDSRGNHIAHFSTSADKGGLSSRFITSFYEDSKHRLWVTTEGGGVCYTEPGFDLDGLSFKTLTTEDGLPSNVTCAIIEDKEGVIWMSTIRGITSISGVDLRVTGLLNGSTDINGYQFSYGAVHSTHNGVFYFGNTEGFISIVPSKIKNTERELELMITEIVAKDSDKEYSLTEPGKSAINSHSVEVKHKHATSISIGFIAPEYSNKQPLYSYTITQGRNRSFTESTYDNEVTFTGLRPGNYTFEVGIVGKDENSKILNINILPHPLRSRTATMIYMLICAFIIFLFNKMLQQRRKREKARQLTKLINKKEKDIFNAKINFFTNITHEIRTPLTLIKMPVDKIISNGNYTAASKKDLLTIQANTDRLLNLTNHLLDMRKMESNELKPSFVKCDICSIVRKAEVLFEQMANEQRIIINMDIPDHPIYLMCISDSVLTIVSNLISNAIKYGNNIINIRIGLSEDAQTVWVRVESNGEVIPEKDRENIFKIFFQREGAAKGVQGTGLGLPYARSLANMHNGRLYLDDKVTELNSFVLELPVNQQEQISIDTMSAVYPDEDILHDFDSSRHTILIAEDSQEMRNYLANELARDYNVIKAANGADALEIVQKEKIDLVISDIMMPIMDGCQLCNRIKSDSDMSHVPVILLTAVVGVETRIETLESGADGYIEKPFPIELLKSNISNLFKNREIAYKQFISKPLTHYNSVTASKVDEDYMDKVHSFIMKHISEQDLNIENLTMQLGTSKSSLYRKLKANTGLSINEYIRLCRLKQAAELLSSQKYKINEVAFMTGFSSPSYFATCFQKQFNITPSDFVKNLGQ